MMNDAFSQRVRSAAIAAWWTVLIGAIWLTIAWVVFRAMMSCPQSSDCMLWAWGGQLTAKEAHAIMITFMAVGKLILFVGVMLAIWLSLWARRLGRQ